MERQSAVVVEVFQKEKSWSSLQHLVPELGHAHKSPRVPLHPILCSNMSSGLCIFNQLPRDAAAAHLRATELEQVLSFPFSCYILVRRWLGGQVAFIDPNPHVTRMEMKLCSSVYNAPTTCQVPCLCKSNRSHRQLLPQLSPMCGGHSQRHAVTCLRIHS